MNVRFGEERSFAEWAYVIFDWNMSTARAGAIERLGLADNATHDRMRSEIEAGPYRADHRDRAGCVCVGNAAVRWGDA